MSKPLQVILLILVILYFTICIIGHVYELLI